MRPGLVNSIILHSIIIFLLFKGLPAFDKKRNYEDHVVTVEILPISELTNVKSKKATPKADPTQEVITKNAPKVALNEPQKPAKDAVKVEPLPQAKITKPENKPKEEPKKPEKIPEKVQPKTEDKKAEPKKDKKPQAPDDAFAAAVKSVEQFREKAEKNDSKEEEKVDFSEVTDFLAKAEQSQYREGVPMSVSEKDAIIQQIMQNWTVPSGIRDIQNLNAVLLVNLQPDGTVSKVTIQNQSRYNSDTSYRTLVDSAMRAIYKSSPLKNLPPEKYDVEKGWREMEVNFDPKEMVE